MAAPVQAPGVLRAQQWPLGGPGQLTSALSWRSQAWGQLHGWRKECSEGKGRGTTLQAVSGTTQSTTSSSNSSVDSTSPNGKAPTTRARQEPSSVLAVKRAEASTAHVYQPRGGVDPAHSVDDLSRDGAILEAANGATDENQAQAPARKARSTAGRKAHTAATSSLPPAQHPGDADVAVRSATEGLETPHAEGQSSLVEAATLRTRRKSAARKKSSKAASLEEAELLSPAHATDLGSSPIGSANGTLGASSPGPPVASADGIPAASPAGVSSSSRNRPSAANIDTEERSGSDSSGERRTTGATPVAGTETGAGDVLRGADAQQLSALLRSAAAQPQAKKNTPGMPAPGPGSPGTPQGTGPASVKLKLPEGPSSKGRLPGGGGGSGTDSFRCDPSTLVPGDHLVHAKLGVCRFLGTRMEVPPGREKAVKYLLLKFADGTAKLSSKQAKQVLYRCVLSMPTAREHCNVCLPLYVQQSHLSCDIRNNGGACRAHHHPLALRAALQS